MLSLIPPIHKASRVFQLPLPLPLSFLLSFFFWSFIEDLKLSSFHGKFSYLLFIFLLFLLLHLLFFLIWLKPSRRSSLKVQFFIFIPPKPQPHLTTSRSACGMRWLKWFNILMIFFQIFLCTIFLHLHLDLISFFDEGIGAHKEEK